MICIDKVEHLLLCSSSGQAALSATQQTHCVEDNAHCVQHLAALGCYVEFLESCVGACGGTRFGSSSRFHGFRSAAARQQGVWMVLCCLLCISFVHIMDGQSHAHAFLPSTCRCNSCSCFAQQALLSREWICWLVGIGQVFLSPGLISGRQCCRASCYVLF